MVKIYEIGLVDSDKGVMIGEAFFNIIYLQIKFMVNLDYLFRSSYMSV